MTAEEILSRIPQYQGLIFDLDGTLVDSMPWHVAAWQQVCREHGFEIGPEVIYQYGGMASSGITEIFKIEGHDVGDPAAFTARKIELYRMHIDKIQTFAEIEKILREAKARGQRVAVGTGTQRVNVNDLLAVHHLSEIVDAVVSSDDVKQHKPNPDTFLKAAELMGLAPENCLVFDDGPVGLQAAKNGGMDCVEVLNGKLVSFYPAH